MGNTILLNADYSFLDTLTTKKAICLVVKGKAEVVKENVKEVYRNFENTFSINSPLVIRLIKFVRLVFKKQVPLTKRNIFVRDRYSCQYCRRKVGFGSRGLTIDHIYPKAKGGKTEWENCVTSCHKCNTFKGSKTLKECGLTLNKKPVRPTIGEFIQIKANVLGVDQIIKDLMRGIS